MNIILFNKDECSGKLHTSDSRARHITGILKSSPGDTLEIGIINGPRGKAVVKTIDNEGIELEFILEKTVPELYPFTLICGLTRPQSVKKILKETTTLGVAKIIFCGTEKGEKSYIESKIWKNEYYKKYLILGAEQAFCTRLPEVKVFHSLKHCLNKGSFAGNSLFALDNYESCKSLTSVPQNFNNPVLAVGSERGWSGKERETLINTGFELYNIGRRVLRTETACVSGITILLSKMGYI
jgi:16S rRNA (uracil1498-N3)-methyltransferase